MKKENKDIIPEELSAEAIKGSDIAENAAVSEPQAGEESFDAESDGTKDAEFERLISGPYKKQFENKVKKIISRRLKEVKQMKETNEKNAQIVELLMQKYNITDRDTEKLERMIKEDMNTVQDKNKTAELLRVLIAENSFLKRDREAQLRRIEEKNRANELRKQVEETKKAYPDFDFEKELKNEEFTRLLKAGVSVKSAYEVLNISTILDKNSKDAEKMVVNAIRYKGKRPVENGSDPTSGIILSSNVSKLTKKEREELAKRAASGEKISF